MGGTRECPKCGIPLDEGVKSCKNCGATVPTHKRMTRKRRRRIIEGLGIAIIFVFIFGYGFFGWWSVNTENIQLHVTGVSNYTNMEAPEGHWYVVLNITVVNDGSDSNLAPSPGSFELKSDKGNSYHYDGDLPNNVPQHIYDPSEESFQLGFMLPLGETPDVLMFHHGIFDSSAKCPKMSG